MFKAILTVFWVSILVALNSDARFYFGELAARRDCPSVNPRGCYDSPKRLAGPDRGGFKFPCVSVS